MRVVFLGPQGTYSQEAAVQAFGDHTPVFATSLDEVVQCVAAGRADGAVLPIENSTNGVVALAVDALLRHGSTPAVVVTGEVRVRIRHQLYTTAPTLAEIHTVYSHPQVWGQAQAWLAANLPQAKRVDCSSTAQAVQFALSRPGTAAVAGPGSSPVPATVANCADDPANTTRFLVLRPGRAGTTYLPAHRVYALARDTGLAHLLVQIEASGGQLQFMAARPSARPWTYNYYLELSQARSLPEDWIVLGSKPVARI